MKLSVLIFIFLASVQLESLGQTNPSDMNILIHVTTGPENPTKAALSFLIAKTAVEEGYAVNLFLAGDAIQLLRNEVLDNLTGLGTGELRKHFDAIVNGGGRFYLSGMSSKSRGLSESDLEGKPAEFAMPKILLQLSIESDKIFVY